MAAAGSRSKAVKEAADSNTASTARMARVVVSMSVLLSCPAGFSAEVSGFVRTTNRSCRDRQARRKNLSASPGAVAGFRRQQRLHQQAAVGHRAFLADQHLALLGEPEAAFVTGPVVVGGDDPAVDRAPVGAGYLALAGDLEHVTRGGTQSRIVERDAGRIAGGQRQGLQEFDVGFEVVSRLG